MQNPKLNKPLQYNPTSTAHSLLLYGDVGIYVGLYESGFFNFDPSTLTSFWVLGANVHGQKVQLGDHGSLIYVLCKLMFYVNLPILKF